VIASTGDRLAAAPQLLPNAITLTCSPDMHGWVVWIALSMIDHPPHPSMSSPDSGTDRGRKLGAFACLRKTCDQGGTDQRLCVSITSSFDVRTLLVVEDNEIGGRHRAHGWEQRCQVWQMGTEGTCALAQPFDCLLLDLRLFLNWNCLKVRKDLALHDLPVIVYWGRFE
jgi:hypothetical protein